ncbi:MAG TPA: hypothetical protein VN456_04685 [Desulfosporosinus sp.]|nr:hypothetical protein [Desulfosporosinus sp.]
MPIGTIGISMNYGYPGSFARNGDCIIMNRMVKKTDTVGPSFGDPVVLNTDNTYSKFGAAGTFALFAGIAIREAKQASTYAATGGVYEPGTPCDVLQRGNISVVCNVGTPIAGGAVYVRITANGAIPAGIVGGLEAAADGANTIALTNCEWATGLKDANGVTELCIKNRNKA